MGVFWGELQIRTSWEHEGKFDAMNSKGLN